MTIKQQKKQKTAKKNQKKEQISSQHSIFDALEIIDTIQSQQNLTPQIMDTPATTTQTTTQKTAEPAPASIKSHSRASSKERSLSTPINSQASLGSQDKIYSTLVKGVKDFFAKNNFKRAVIGVSGGIDSALTLKIAVDALGSENITALIMPELGISREENIDHAKMLCEFFEVEVFYMPINSFMTDFRILPWEPNQNAYMNSKARIRSVLLYNLANTQRALVLGTSNKSELLLGYGTKFGDMAADIEIIGDLYKTEVIALADHIGLPPEIVNKVPSAELAKDQTDEADLGATYKDIDSVLAKLDLGEDECINRGISPALVRMVFRRVKENHHKLEMPPIIKITN